MRRCGTSAGGIVRLCVGFVTVPWLAFCPLYIAAQASAEIVFSQSEKIQGLAAQHLAEAGDANAQWMLGQGLLAPPDSDPGASFNWFLRAPFKAIRWLNAIWDRCMKPVGEWTGILRRRISGTHWQPCMTVDGLPSGGTRSRPDWTGSSLIGLSGVLNPGGLGRKRRRQRSVSLMGPPVSADSAGGGFRAPNAQSPC
jgi:hypothetical protein